MYNMKYGKSLMDYLKWFNHLDISYFTNVHNWLFYIKWPQFTIIYIIQLISYNVPKWSVCLFFHYEYISPFAMMSLSLVLTFVLAYRPVIYAAAMQDCGTMQVLKRCSKWVLLHPPSPHFLIFNFGFLNSFLSSCCFKGI